MKDWKERLEELDVRMDAWNARFSEAYHAALRRGRGLLGVFRSPSETEREDAARAAAKAAGEAPHDAVSEFFDDLSLYFLEASITERTKIRARIGASRALLVPLWSWISAAPAHLRGPEDVDRLRRAVAGIAIDDVHVDITDLWQALTALWLAASRAGIDPRPVLAEVAAVANRGTSGGGAHMREILTEFEGSKHFAEHVRPQLRAA